MHSSAPGLALVSNVESQCGPRVKNFARHYFSHCIVLCSVSRPGENFYIVALLSTTTIWIA